MNTPTDKCPRCGSALVKRQGKFGDFLACAGYPDCNYTVNAEQKLKKEAEIIPDAKCPICDGAVVVREGEYGRFFGCNDYPYCKWSASSLAEQKPELECPQCFTGSLKKRTSKTGKDFYSCSNYPDCDYNLPKEPIARACPHCAWPVTLEKVTKRKGKEQVCPKCKRLFPLKD